MLDHPDLSWLPTQEEKVACFQQLGIETWMLPRRIYAGQAKGRVQYFPLRMPVAMGPEAAVFVYIDPGMGTRTELHSWGAAHRALWEKLRESGRRIEVVAVAWEQHLLDRAERVMRSWVGRDLTEAGRELLILHSAVSSADWETVERYGGLNAALKKINQLKQATPKPQGLGMIDDFRLWGSRRCRRTHAPLTNEGWLIQVAHQVAHAYGNCNATLSEGAPSLLWSGPCLESLIGGGLARIPRVGCDNAKRGCASCFRASPGAPHGREEGGESDPRILASDAARGRVRLFRPLFILLPCPWGSLSPQRSLAGRPSIAFSRSR